MLEAGDKAPALQVADDSGATVTFKSLLGGRLVLYFYPKADTPGCTNESMQFRDLYKKFKKAGAEIVGVSRDTPGAQTKFKQKYDLPFRLLADVGSEVCNAFGVIVEKNMYGKKSMGIQRSTFVIDAKGKVERVWPKVKVDGHAEDVLAYLEGGEG
jgi:peroxiredoxin Q/BCP